MNKPTIEIKLADGRSKTFSSGEKASEWYSSEKSIQYHRRKRKRKTKKNDQKV